jgi:hypothetical protein
MISTASIEGGYFFAAIIARKADVDMSKGRMVIHLNALHGIWSMPKPRKIDPWKSDVGQVQSTVIKDV